MRRLAMAAAAVLCGSAAFAQTFVPRRPLAPSAPAESRSIFGDATDLENSLGRVAEAPKLMPRGGSASQSPDAPERPSALPIVPVLSLATALGVAVVAVGATRRARTARPAPPRTDRSA